MAIQTVKIADKNTLDEIKTILKDSGYGLDVVKDLIETGTNKQLLSIALLDSVYNSSWTEVSTLPYKFCRGSAVVYDNEIHILGGYGMGTNHYKFDGTDWTSVSTLPFRFTEGSAVVYDNEIHILGGSGDNTAHYKFDGIGWSDVSSIPYIFYNGIAVLYDNKIHILGSEDMDTRTNHFDLVSLNVIRMYLSKDSKIYSPYNISSITNCTFDTDHLVVSEDGDTMFNIDSPGTSSMVTIIENGGE